MTDQINQPAHYAQGRQFEPIDVITDWELGFCLGNALKYISRAGRKGMADDEIRDLRKAVYYLNREIDYMVEMYYDDEEQQQLNGEIPASVLGGSDEDVPFDSSDEWNGEGFDFTSWTGQAEPGHKEFRDSLKDNGSAVIYTSKEGGYTLGHQANGTVRIIGHDPSVYAAIQQSHSLDLDLAPSEYEPEYDAFNEFVFEFDR